MASKKLSRGPNRSGSGLTAGVVNVDGHSGDGARQTRAADSLAVSTGGEEGFVAVAVTDASKASYVAMTTSNGTPFELDGKQARLLQRLLNAHWPLKSTS